MDISDSVLNYFLIPAVKAVVVVVLVATAAGILTYIERRTLAFLQVRKGPNRVGPEGILQFVADVVKLLTKEDVVPAKAQHFIHFLAPVLVMVPGLAVFAVLPWGPEFTMRIPGLGKITTAWYAADLNVSLLLVLAITSIGVYGIILGGWASNSKYALLGGLRSAAQLISYEVPMGFAVVSAILMARSLSLVEIVEAQRAHHIWFILPGLVAFLLYFVSGVAETNRIPFDLPEAESELVAGFHTEYSGFRWAIFFLTEYANMITISAVATALFFGGWLRPFPNVAALAFLDVIPGVIWYVLKVACFLFVYIWFRGTFPRYRFDQLMALGWKTLIPISLVNLVLVAVAALGGTRGLRILGTVLWVVAAGAFLIVTRLRAAKPPATKTVPAPAAPGRRTPDMSFWDDVLLLDIFGGLRMTGRHLFRKADTVEYPEAAREPSDRFRGMFRLDEERCIKCTLCAIECPINIIFIDWHNEKNEAGKNEKVLDRFDVDLKRCMFCGLCEEACPTNPKSIWLRTKTYELGTYERNEALYLDIRKLTKWDENVKPFTVVEPGEGR